MWHKWTNPKVLQKFQLSLFYFKPQKKGNKIFVSYFSNWLNGNIIELNLRFLGPTKQVGSINVDNPNFISIIRTQDPIMVGQCVIRTGDIVLIGTETL